MSATISPPSFASNPFFSFVLKISFKKLKDGENEQIEAWLNADEEHLRIAKQLNTLYLAVDTQHITKKIDTEKALDKVKSRTKVRNLSWPSNSRTA